MTYQVQVARPVSKLINLTEVHQNKVEVTRVAKTNVSVTQGTPTSLAITAGAASALTVNSLKVQVSAQPPVNTSTVTVIAAGPQGPPFVGANFFDNVGIGNLTASAEGALLSWDGELFRPTQTLENNLTINGGAF